MPEQRDNGKYAKNRDVKSYWNNKRKIRKIEKELDMNTCRYSKLLEDLKQCTELITCDIDEMVIELSKREKKALIEVIDIFENIFMHFEDTDSLRYYLDDDDDED